MRAASWLNFANQSRRERQKRQERRERRRMLSQRAQRPQRFLLRFFGEIFLKDFSRERRKLRFDSKHAKKQSPQRFSAFSASRIPVSEKLSSKKLFPRKFLQKNFLCDLRALCEKFPQTNLAGTENSRECAQRPFTVRTIPSFISDAPKLSKNPSFLPESRK